MKQAVSIILRVLGKIYVVSRRNDTTQWGLPGGKVDPGETPDQAVLRELFEEVGVKLWDRVIPIYSGFCPGKDGNHFWVTTYLFDYTFNEDYFPVKLEEGLEGKFAHPSLLTDEKTSPFSDYNKRAFQALQNYYRAQNVK